MSTFPILLQSELDSLIRLVENADWDEALKVANELIYSRQESEILFNLRGYILGELGDLQGAIADYNKALDLDPGYIFAHSNLGSLLVSSGNIVEGISHLIEAAERKPNFANPLCNLANAYNLLEQYDSAVNAANKALEIDPNLTEALNNLGIALNGLGKSDQAIQVFKRALQLNPSFAQAYCNLGGIYAASSNLALALECYENAVRIAPGYYAAIGGLVAILRNLGRVEEALHFEEKGFGVVTFDFKSGVEIKEF